MQICHSICIIWTTRDCYRDQEQYFRDTFDNLTWYNRSLDNPIANIFISRQVPVVVLHSNIRTLFTPPRTPTPIEENTNDVSFVALQH